MNREILFRGKRIDNGEWVEGSLLITEILGGTDYEILKRNRGMWQTSYKVDPSTVGQYTGLTDKNDLKIFEGDVIEFDAYGLHYKGEVFFDEGAFCVTCNHPTASTFLIIALYHDTVCVGNMHDAPELLEGD